MKLRQITKITGQCDITGAFKVTGPSNLTGPVTIAPSLTCAMMTGNLMGNALTATKAITASALG